MSGCFIIRLYWLDHLMRRGRIHWHAYTAFLTSWVEARSAEPCCDRYEGKLPIRRPACGTTVPYTAVDQMSRGEFVLSPWYSLADSDCLSIKGSSLLPSDPGLASMFRRMRVVAPWWDGRWRYCRWWRKRQKDNSPDYARFEHNQRQNR